MKIERVLNSYLKYISELEFQHVTVLWVYKYIYSIRSHWDFAFKLTIFSMIFHPWYTNAIFTTMNVLSTIYPTMTDNCTCCKKLFDWTVNSMPCLPFIQFQMILFSLPATFHFNKISAGVYLTYTYTHQIQLVKCEFYPHSTTENV